MNPGILRPRIGVGVVAVHEGKVLLGKRKGSLGAGQWAVPGGHLEFGESIEECAQRELLEETGLKALSLSLGPWTENLIVPQQHYITFFVFVDQFEGTPQLLEPHKCEGWEWFKWDQLPSPLFTTVQALIQKMTIEKLKKIENSIYV